MPNAMLMRLAALALVLAGDAGAQVTIPRYTGAIPAGERRFIEGMNYTPADAPLRWLPNGELIVMHLEQYNSADVYGSTCRGTGVFVVSAAGEGAARALTVDAPVCDPAREREGATIDPSGTRFVASVYSAGHSRLISIDLKSGRVDTLHTGCTFIQEQPEFSRDGHFIATHGSCEGRRDEYAIYAMTADAKHLHRIGPIDSASHSTPTWSATSTRLAYVRMSGSIEHRIDEIVVVDSTGKARNVVAHGYAPAWSPADEWIAFIAPRRQDESEIHLVRPDGTGERVLFRNAVRSTYYRGWGPMREGAVSSSLVWSPDGRELAFSRSFDQGSTIWTADVVSGRIRQITRSAR